MNDNLPNPGVDASVRPMQLNCPHCQAILTVHPSQAGLVADCPKCSGKFHVPVPMAKPWDPGKTNAYSNDEALSESREFIGKKIAAGICGLLLGGLGVHKFFLGLNNAGFIMLAVSLGGVFLGPCLIFPFFGPMIMGLVGFIEGIIYLTKPDDEFYQTYAIEKKEWF